MSRTVLDEIQEALERATPGPWRSNGSARELVADEHMRLRFLRGDRATGMYISTPNTTQGPEGADADIIVLLRNKANPLLAVVRAAAEAELLSGPEGATVAETQARRRLRDTLRTLDPRLLGES